MREYFSSLYGNSSAKSRIGAAIENGTLPHAFLICGPDGSGKSTLALEIAAAVNCEVRHDARYPLPCRRCNTCRRIFSDGFTDIKRLGLRRDKQSIGVEEIRDYREDMFLSATESDHKIYIINDADKMTVNAQNALLKVLEEPPSGVIIFLLSQSDDGILTTIKSRTQYIAMQRFSPDELSDYFRKESKLTAVMDQKRKTDLFMCADGRIGRALKLLGEEGESTEAMRRVTENIVSALKQSTPYSTLYSAIRALPTKKNEFAEAIESVISAVRDLIVLKNAPDAALVFFSDRDMARSLSEEISLKRLIGIYDILKDTLEDNARNVNIAAMTTSLGAKIKLI